MFNHLNKIDEINGLTHRVKVGRPTLLSFCSLKDNNDDDSSNSNSSRMIIVIKNDDYDDNSYNDDCDDNRMRIITNL